jgi:hypothetical protein
VLLLCVVGDNNDDDASRGDDGSDRLWALPSNAPRFRCKPLRPALLIGTAVQQRVEALTLWTMRRWLDDNDDGGNGSGM